MGILAIVILVIGIVIGLIVMVVIATVIFRQHMKILRKYQDAREMEVVDLDGSLAVDDHHTPLMV